VGQRAAIGRDVVRDQLAEEGPAGGDVDGVVTGVAPVADAARAGEPEEPLLVSLDRGQIREEPLVLVRCATDGRGAGPRRREATAGLAQDGSSVTALMNSMRSNPGSEADSSSANECAT
jgi:hypothetical protein